MWRLISVRTLSSVLVRKWVAPIQALRVPNGCSTVCRRTPMASGMRSSRACILEHVLILPAFDDPPLGRGAPGSERTGDAGAQVAVAVEVFGVIRAAMDFGEFCARRTGVVVALGVVDEVLPGEQAALGPARCQGLGHDRCDARAFAREDLVAAEVAAVGQGGDLLAARGLLRLARHGRKLVAVVSLVDHLVATIRWCSASTAICTL